jgi:hypothetical protein
MSGKETIMIERLNRQLFTILKYTKTGPDAGGSYKTDWVPQEPLYGVVTRVTSTDTELTNSDILSRQKRIRAFSELNISYLDKILLDGEKWKIVGEPESVPSMRNRRVKSTVIIIEKEGKN